MVRQTSLDSYLDLVKSGVLGQMQEKILYALYHLKVASDSEIALYLKFSDLNKVRPRRFELVDLGYVVEAGKFSCSVTGRNVIKWKVNDGPITKKDNVKRKLSIRELTQLYNYLARASDEQKIQIIQVLKGEQNGN
jgi:hypothetical protein